MAVPLHAVFAPELFLSVGMLRPEFPEPFQRDGPHLSSPYCKHSALPFLGAERPENGSAAHDDAFDLADGVAYRFGGAVQVEDEPRP